MFRKLMTFYRRGNYGWDYSDCFSMDTYLSEIIPQMLRHLATKDSCSAEFYNDKNKDNECHKWKKVLIEMAEGFEKFNELENNFVNSQNYKKEYKKAKENRDKSLKLFIKYFDNLWW